MYVTSAEEGRSESDSRTRKSASSLQTLGVPTCRQAPQLDESDHDRLVGFGHASFNLISTHDSHNFLRTLQCRIVRMVYLRLKEPKPNTVHKI